MSKRKKRQRHDDASDPFVVVGDEFPEAITVELWHRLPKGKRELVDSRRYDLAAPSTDSVALTDPVETKVSAANDGVKGPPSRSRSATGRFTKKPPAPG